MSLLTGKTALIFGVANNRSIAWGITKAFHDHGARIGLSYAGEMLEKRIKPLAEEIGVTFVEPCDVGKDEDIAAVVEKAKAEFGTIDILVHAVAYAGREELARPFVETSRAGFKTAMEISVYSFVALANAFRAITNSGGSYLTLSYYGGVKVVPKYNVMGVAKAGLEMATRYLAYDLGPSKIRVNAISAGPIRTLAAAGVGSFKKLAKHFSDVAPLRENVTQEDIGNSAVYLCSDLASKVTGEIHYVDCGFNVMTVPENVEE